MDTAQAQAMQHPRKDAIFRRRGIDVENQSSRAVACSARHARCTRRRRAALSAKHGDAARSTRTAVGTCVKRQAVKPRRMSGNRQAGWRKRSRQHCSGTKRHSWANRRVGTHEVVFYSAHEREKEGLRGKQPIYLKGGTGDRHGAGRGRKEIHPSVILFSSRRRKEDILIWRMISFYGSWGPDSVPKLDDEGGGREAWSIPLDRLILRGGDSSIM